MPTLFSVVGSRSLRAIAYVSARSRRGDEARETALGDLLYIAVRNLPVFSPKASFTLKSLKFSSSSAVYAAQRSGAYSSGIAGSSRT